ncbi:MAG: DUF3592 domain-containing protein [Pseudomonadota bacterium]
MSLALVPGIVLLLGGAWLTVMFSTAIIRAIESNSWPTAPGVMRRAELEFDPTDRTYSVDIAYVFEIDGEEITSSVVRFGDRVAFPNKLKAINYIHGYSAGKKVQVYYCPSDPHTAVLRPGASFRAMQTGIYGATLLLTGSVIFAHSLR